MTIDTFTFSSISTLSSDQLITLTIGQLQDLVAQAVQEVIQPLVVRMDALQAQITKMESLQEQDVTRIYCDIAQDRQRITKLERPPEPQPTQKDRAEILRALLAANGGKMLAKDARKKMRLSAYAFSKLLKVCDFIDRKSYHLDRRQDILILKS